MDYQKRYQNLKTPCYVVSRELLIHNLEILKHVKEESGCKILLAQKCFSMYETYPLIGEYLDGTTASGLYEARLGKEEMGLENHVYAAAYKEADMDEIFKLCDHVVFNSFSQWERFREKARQAGKSCGIRINPECSTQEGHAIYDPCAPKSRMGVTRTNFREKLLDGIEGLHFHTLCEQNADALVTTLKAAEEKFGKYFHQMKWLNLGGGHHITREDYDVELLIREVKRLRETYNVEVYLEPGEAVALNAGFLVSEVLDVIDNGGKIAILDTSAACHMPDVLEMPYQPEIEGAVRLCDYEDVCGSRDDKACEENRNSEQNVESKENIESRMNRNYIYRLGGPTCLAGDVIGDYVFDKTFSIGDKLIFKDMAIYSMVKNNTFNGMPLPGIYYDEGKKIRCVKSFGYDAFKERV